MSHISVYKTQLKAITKEFLISSLEAFIKTQPGMKLITGTKLNDMYMWRSQSVVAAIEGRTLRNGIGFRIRNNCLEIVGDSWGQVDEYAKYSELVPAFIKAQVVMATTRKTHPNAKIQMQIQGKEVLMKAVIYEGC